MHNPPLPKRAFNCMEASAVMLTKQWKILLPEVFLTTQTSNAIITIIMTVTPVANTAVKATTAANIPAIKIIKAFINTQTSTFVLVLSL